MYLKDWSLILFIYLDGKKDCFSSKSIEEKGENGLEEERRLGIRWNTRAFKIAKISFNE